MRYTHSQVLTMTDNDRADAGDEETDRPTIELTPEHEQEEYEPPSDEEVAEWYESIQDRYSEEAHAAADARYSDYEGDESAEPSNDKTETGGTHQHTLTPESDDRRLDHVSGSVTRFHVVEEDQSRVAASGAVLPDGTVAVTPRHPQTGDPLEGQTGTWPSLDHYRVSAIGRGQSITFEDGPSTEGSDDSTSPR